MGGTILIGGAAGAAGGVLGAVPAVIIRHNEIHSLGDLFTVARQAAITGFAGGFLGGATNSLRSGVHSEAGGGGIRPPATVKIDPDTPAALHFVRGHQQNPIFLDPGHSRSLDTGFLNGHTLVNGVNNHEIRIGRDQDGRVWVHDLQTEGSMRTKVDGEALSFDEKRYLTSDHTLEFGDVSTQLKLGPEAPIEMRLFDDPKIPPVMLAPGERIVLGKGPESPLSEHFNDISVSAKHASIYRDLRGHVWISDEHSRTGTFVENRRVDPDRPVRIYPGERFRLGEWAGSTQYTREGFHHPFPRPTSVHLNGPDGGGFSVDLRRGGEPVLLGRNDPRLPTDLPGRQQLSPEHVSIGVHPSGKVWIRDEGSDHGTSVGGVPIQPGEQVTVRPGDPVSLAGGAFEFVVNFPPADGGPFLHRLDSADETKSALGALTQIPHPMFERVVAHLNEQPDGGFVMGQMPISKMPGLETTVANNPEGPNPLVTWENLGGLYSPDSRRIYVDTRPHPASDRAWIPLHEVGHAVDHAYATSDGGRLRLEPDWAGIHNDMLISISKHADWWKYRNDSGENFAEAFAAWTAGPEHLTRIACGNERIAARVKEYFDRLLE
ncbi:FHA domain-containing protein [Nocardia sp. NPDC056100]|uniref:FHA domain-containing protein n=1 Tax=Nocardia sp. NPDC056100 TaxID=3345712 RepID=UPI0035DD8E52